MKKLFTPVLIIVGCLFVGFIYYSSFLNKGATSSAQQGLRTSGAAKGLNNWYFDRAYPTGKIPIQKLEIAFEQKEQFLDHRTPSEGEWESLGPQNISGRILALAMDPDDPNILYAASASGGLWRSETAGEGIHAWEQITTGYPSLSIGAIAVHPEDGNILLAGTGEVYGNVVTEPGTINRLTRGIYGIGILRSDDKGLSWDKVLEFNIEDLHGVQDIEFSSADSDEVYAATTDGLFQSLDAGRTWKLILDVEPCIDVEIDPDNPDIIYVTMGNFNYNLDPALSGIYKSTDKGKSFVELQHPGLLNAWSGNAKLSIDPNNSDRIYASIQVGWFNTDDTTPAGLYLSEDQGSTWNKINDQNIAMFQGWYSHDIAINPENSQEMMYVGINGWRSTDGGYNFIQKSFQAGWQFGEISVDVPEGGPQFVHADLHAVYYHPANNYIYLASDGGVFVSKDGGETYTTLNGGLQTMQFYADVSSSTTNPDLFIGGTQDNASYIYRGQPSWFRIIGGDGMTAAINPENEDMMFGSYQFLNILRSDNGGFGFMQIGPNRVQNDPAPFSGHYVIAPSLPGVMYAGATHLYQTTNSGMDWTTTSGQPVDPGNFIVKIAVSPRDHQKLLLATAPNPLAPQNQPGLFRSFDGGSSFVELSGLPDRVCKDIEFDPTNDDRAYAVFSGFGTDHVYVTEDFGENWRAIDNGLPDIPTNTIFIDPLFPQRLYAGNDMGVYYSEDGGNTWRPWGEGLPEVILAMDLSYSPVNRKLRVATHGNGVYQRDLIEDVTSSRDEMANEIDMSLFPNPTRSDVNINLKLEASNNIELVLVNASGALVDMIYDGTVESTISLKYEFLRSQPAGTYHILVKDKNEVLGYGTIVVE